MESRKVLITGGSGFIGKPILELFKLNNINISMIGRNRPKEFSGTFFEADLYKSSKSEIFKILKLAKPTHLIHLAWYTEHEKFWNAEENIIWINKTTNLIKSFCEVGGRSIIVAGTCAEYSWNNSTKLSENSKCEPNTIYGISKNVTRQLASKICDKARVDLAWCRIFFPYGPGDNQKKFIPSLRKIIDKKKKPFEIKQPGSRDYLHVNDIAEAIFAIYNNNKNGVINICSGISYDLKDLMIKVLKHRGENFNERKLHIFYKKKNIVNIVGNNRTLLNLGWKPKNDLYLYLLE